MIRFRIVEHHPKELYGGPVPTTDNDFRQLLFKGIKAIVSTYPIPEDCDDRLEQFDHLKLYIPDYHPPTVKQVQSFLDFFREHVNKKMPVYVHCFAGCGRTGTIIALTELFCYGASTAEKAIERVQSREPCSIDSHLQYAFIYKMAYWANLDYAAPPSD
ncbi:MAG: protein-tyrosine phosphatase family protein [Candidatus Ranarchaeia archaeon]